MDKWMKVTLAVTVPALSFLVLNDTVQGFYGPSRDQPLAYSVVEEEAEPEVEEEAAVAEETPAEETDTAMVTTEEEPADQAVVEPGPEEELTEDVAVAEEVPVEEGTTEEALAVEDTATDAAATTTAMLTPEEMEAGEAAARACASCHQFARERNAAGPHLVGLDGRVIGSVDGFRYSRALQDLNAEGRVWDMETLQTWLENPDAFAEGTRMMYQVNDAEERRLISGWLTQREN